MPDVPVLWDATLGISVMGFVREVLTSPIFYYGLAALVAVVLVSRLLGHLSDFWGHSPGYWMGYAVGSQASWDHGLDSDYAPANFATGYSDGYSDVQKEQWEDIASGDILSMASDERLRDLLSDGY